MSGFDATYSPGQLTPQLLDLYVGSAPWWPVTLSDETGAALNLTGATLWMTCKSSESALDADALFQKTNGSGITIIDASAGQVLIQPSTTDTDALTAGTSYYFDIQLLTSAGELVTVMVGILRARSRITLAQTS